ncbi:transcription factor MYB98-like [Rhodamnia argentea]|uniref:Transcription factor MYB98-like n=1 Tax=Rhodamnia argentea TaxID=178133 RepID=A0ABM3H4S4_9MYRT|nr:transcription factor MYB98-like [Rhodamnia argentea]
MLLLDLNEPPLLNERLGEEISSGGMNSDSQWGHEWDDGGDDWSKREVVTGLPHQQQKQRTGKKKRESEDSKVDKEPLVIKGQWTLEEDRLLTMLVEMHEQKKWSQIAQILKGRVRKQYRERWHNHLRPDIKQKDPWSIKEDKILIQAHMRMGNKWAKIAKILPGRTDNNIKNRWNATKCKQLSQRKFLPNNDDSNLLQDYIKSVTTPSPPE